MQHNASATKQLLKQFGLTPKPALGQNFLCNEAAVCAICTTLRPGLGVLEVGPGLGALTQGLLQAAPAVAAVELDAAMVQVLEHRFFQNPKLHIIHCDFLKADMQELAGITGTPFEVAANLPYYATTPICQKLLRCPDIAGMTLMVQLEAAERFFAGPGERVYGPLAVAARCFYQVEMLLELPPSSYWPQPDVRSAVLRLERNGTPFCPTLFPLVAQAFSMRRKTLQNNLKPLGLGAEALQNAGLEPGLRAEALPPEAFLRLAEHLGQQAWQSPG